VERVAPRRILDLGLTGPIILVDAPAGWGKTTAVASWVRGQDRPTAWLSLDPTDDEPVRFWTYLIEATRAVRPGFGDTALELVRSPGTGLLTAALPALVNELTAETESGLVLVLDDYHVILNNDIHAGMIFLLEHLINAHVVIITRADPPFPLPRWRARAALTELRIDDLRFDSEDAEQLFNTLLGRELDEGSLRGLCDRTEGWAAGLVLAALSIRGQLDPSTFVKGFAGDDRHIVDYLGSEVLDSLDEDTRQFLVHTSILDRLTAPLCDAVLNRSDSTQALTRIERANLFLTPVDNRGEWFRYHQLFAELLRIELELTEPDQVPILHSRASGWFAGHGNVAEAVRHAVAAGTPRVAADLLSDQWSLLLQSGDLAGIVQSLEVLSDDFVRTDPRLCLIRAWMTINLGRVGDLADWIDAADTALKESDESDKMVFGAAAGMLRCIEAYLTGNAGGAIDAATRAVELDAVEIPPWRSVGCPVLGIALYWTGRPEESVETLQPAVRRAREAGNHLAQLHGTGCLALAAADRGEMPVVSTLVGQALQIQETHGFRDHWAGAMTLLAQGRMELDAGRLDHAVAAITEAVRLSRRGLARIELAYGLLSLAQIELRRGRPSETTNLVNEAQHALSSCADPGVVLQLASSLARQVGVVSSQDAPRLPFGEKLSDRERSVLLLLPTELSLPDIASSLFVSSNTVKTHTRAIYRKLGVARRIEAVDRAQELGLI
jgi:LuxR family maltose regulon positive regulatory protein